MFKTKESKYKDNKHILNQLEEALSSGAGTNILMSYKAIHRADIVNTINKYYNDQKIIFVSSVVAEEYFYRDIKDKVTFITHEDFLKGETGMRFD